MFVGAIVMLRQNLDPEIGRHNGAIFQVWRSLSRVILLAIFNR
jgi:hypothetical protein